ncbi:unnamed protein product, partial [Larinioides sclopetarius]
MYRKISQIRNGLPLLLLPSSLKTVTFSQLLKIRQTDERQPNYGKHERLFPPSDFLMLVR